MTGREQGLIDKVGRTFALTLRVFSGSSSPVVKNLYLWWRFADTIEDDRHMTAAEKREFLEQIPSLWDKDDAFIEQYRRSLLDRLADDTKPGERELIGEIPRMAATVRTFPENIRRGMRRSLLQMTSGMAHYQFHHEKHYGLLSMDQVRDYCHLIAGGSARILVHDIIGVFHRAPTDQRLEPLFDAYGQTIQIANILKDIWEDRERGICWLPRDVFSRTGMRLEDMRPGEGGDPWRKGLNRIIALTRRQYEQTIRMLTYTHRRDWRLRLLGLWTAGMAIGTIRRVYRNPFFHHAGEVRLSRSDVYRLGLLSVLCSFSNYLLPRIFLPLCRDLPSPAPPDERHAT